MLYSFDIFFRLFGSDECPTKKKKKQIFCVAISNCWTGERRFARKKRLRKNKRTNSNASLERVRWCFPPVRRDGVKRIWKEGKKRASLRVSRALDSQTKKNTITSLMTSIARMCRWCGKLCDVTKHSGGEALDQRNIRPRNGSAALVWSTEKCLKLRWMLRGAIATALSSPHTRD